MESLEQIWYRLRKIMRVRLATLSTVHYHQCVDYWQEEVKGYREK